LNYLLHKSISYASDENALINNVISTINNQISKNHPIKSINLVADGSANYAKILLQKKRRLLTIKNPTNATLNPLILTTGTMFMNTFDDAIKTYAKSTFNSINVNLDLSKNCGEAEFKICKLLRKNGSTLSDTHLIISNDADTILIALSQINVFNIFVLISNNNNHRTYVVSIDKLTESIFENYGYMYNKKLDFVFISLLNGNDYFPKLKYTNIDKLWDVYNKTVKKNEFIVNLNCTINISKLIDFICGILSTIPSKMKSVSLNEYNFDDVTSYMFGLQWCIQLYTTGEYPTYDYIHNANAIHPSSLLMYIIDYRKKNECNTTSLIQCDDGDKIPSEFYTVFVIPFNRLDLVQDKFHNIIKEKLMYMYDEEFCEKCKKYRSQLKLLGNCKSKEISSVKKKYSKHHKIHTIKNPCEYIKKIYDALMLFDK